MRLIITRPADDAVPLAQRLTALGHIAASVPLLRIVPRTGVDVPDRPWQALCVTSANAVRNIRLADSLKSIPVFTVGPQSLAEVQRCGFTNATAQGGDVDRLVAYLRQRLDPQAGPVLYLSGAETSGDLSKKLGDCGFTVHRAIVYDAVALVPDRLLDDVQSADGVLLYSPRSANLWLKALGNRGIEMAVKKKLMHFCLSAQVAAKLPREISTLIAPSPDEGGMFSLLDRGSEAE